MSTRRLPVISTIVVLMAVGTMTALGVWQLQRLQWKEALLARYADAAGNAAPVAFPLSGSGEVLLYRQSAVDCERVLAVKPRAGRSAKGASGWAQRAYCASGGTDAVIAVDIGWTRTPDPVAWTGGTVSGVIAPGPRLVATVPPVPGIEPLARPDPSGVPNNHLAYAVQWFFFALTALVIYALALRRRWRH